MNRVFQKCLIALLTISLLIPVIGCSSADSTVTTQTMQLTQAEQGLQGEVVEVDSSATAANIQATSIAPEVIATQTQTTSDSESTRVPREDKAIQWVDPVLEALVREKLEKPDGDIMQSELDDIWGIELIGDSHLYFNAKGGYDMYKNPETYFADGIFYSDKIDNPAGILLETDLEALNSLKEGTYWVEGQAHTRGVITSLADFSNFRDVKFLNVYKNNLSDLTGLESLEELVVLRLIECSIVDISKLGGLEKVETLNLDSNQIVDVSPLYNLRRLTWLSIMDNHVENIEGFSALTNLVLLRLSHNPIESIEALVPLNHLFTLRIDYTKVNDLSALIGKTSLNHLLMTHLDADRVDLEPLATISELKVLEASQDKAELLNIRSLAELKQMRMIGMFQGKQSVKLPNEDADWLQAQLPQCVFDFKPN